MQMMLECIPALTGNGFNLEKIDKYVGAGVKFVDISLESVNPQLHNENWELITCGKMQLNPLKNTMKRMFMWRFQQK